MCQLLKNIIIIRKHLLDVSITSFGFNGTFIPKDNNDVQRLQSIKSHLRESYYKNSQDEVDIDKIQLNVEIIISIDLSDNTPFYESVSSFIQANKFSLIDEYFYISEIDYLECDNSQSDIVNNYKTNLNLIKLLHKISDYKNELNKELELFFYKSENGIALKIDYTQPDLLKDFTDIKCSIIELNEHFNHSSDSSERKQIFINELIAILKQKGNSYSNLIENWSILINNYKKSFSLYLSGFSFEKVKTASVEYFHDLSDRMHSTVIKFSTYIFGIPIAYIFLLRFLDFSGESFIKDTFLLVLGIIFFLLIWFVILKSIGEAIDAIAKDINSFKSKIERDENLTSIWEELDEQTKNTIPKQKKKLKLVKGLTIIILGILIAAYLYIYTYSESINIEKGKSTITSLDSIKSDTMINNKLDTIFFETKSVLQKNNDSINNNK